MKLGMCIPIEQAAEAKRQGWDYVEATAQGLLQGDLSDEQWTGEGRVKAAPLPVPAANALIPPGLKITGQEASLDRLRAYMDRVLGRAERVGIKTVVFGSGMARTVPDGFDRARAREQVFEFARMMAPICQRHGITLVCEPLNRGECNIINSVAEAMEYVKAVDHSNFQCLVDSYHLWLEDEPLENVRRAMPWIKHVHLADTRGRVPPGDSGENDYRPLFSVLKQAGYDGLITVECIGYPNLISAGPRTLAFLKKQWAEA